MRISISRSSRIPLAGLSALLIALCLAAPATAAATAGAPALAAAAPAAPASAAGGDAKTLLRDAQRLLARGEPDSARALCGEALRLSPRDPDAFLVLGATFARRLEEGEAAIGALDTTSAGPFLARAQMYWAAQRLDRALSAFEHAAARARVAGDRPALARALNGRATALTAGNRAPEAEPARREAIALSEALGDTALTGKLHGGLAEDLEAQGKYDGALEAAETMRLVAAARGDLKGVAQAHHRLGSIHRRRAAYDEALASFEQALEAARALGDRTGEGAMLGEIGSVRGNRGDYPGALEAFRRSAAAFEAAGDRRNLGISLGNIGNTLSGQGRLAEADSAFAAALDIARAMKDRRREGFCLGSLASVRSGQGRYEQAIAFYVEAIAIAGAGGDRARKSLWLGDLGYAYQDQGRYTEALDCFEEARRIAVEIGDLKGQVQQALNAGSLHRLLGDDDRASGTFEEGLRLAREIGTRAEEADLLTEIGRMQTEAGHLFEARASFDEALAIHRETRNARGEMSALDGAGLVSKSRGDLDEAAAAHRACLETARRVGYRKGIVQAQLHLAADRLDAGAIEEAGALYDEAARAARSAGLTEGVISAEAGAGAVRLREGDLEGASAHYAAAVAMLEQTRGRLLLPEERIGYFGVRAEIYREYAALAARLGRIDDAFAAAEQGRARTLRELLDRHPESREERFPEAMRLERNEIVGRMTLAQRAIVAALESSPPDEPSARRALAERDSLDVAYEQWRRRAAAGDSALAPLDADEPLTAAKARTLLTADEALLLYSIGERSSLLIVVTGGDSTRAFTLPGRGEIAAGVLELRRSLGIGDPSVRRPRAETFASASSRLSRLLLPEDSRTLLERSSLIVSPDGPLHYVPFELLLSGEPPRDDASFGDLPYLVSTHEVMVVPSAAVLARLRRRPVRDDAPLLAIGDPELEGDGGSGAGGGAYRGAGFDEPVAGGQVRSLRDLYPTRLSSLPGSRREVEAVAELFGPDGSDVYLRAEARELRLKEPGVERFGTVHLATHGWIDEERPEWSALVFSKESGSLDDGLLSLREVYGLHLDANLVVLSGCATGTGPEVTGEGIIGLMAGFLSAGARSVLVSVWSVRDDPTARFMIAFHEACRVRHRSAREALAEAKRAFIASGGPDANPRVWAPFVLVGGR